MTILPEATKLRLHEHYDSVQTAFHHNQALIDALEDTLNYFDNSQPEPSCFFWLYHISQTFQESLFSLKKRQQDLQFELKALQVALILNP